MKTKPDLSIIVPAYNEEMAIKETITKLKQMNGNHEIIVVDDGSTDDTFEIAKKMAIQVIKHSQNKGYGAALKTGIRNAKADVVLFFDADGQHNHADIQMIVREIDNYDMVVGARTRKSSRSFIRGTGKKFLSIIANYLAETKIPDLNSGLRAVKKSVVSRFMHILPNTFSFSTTITLALLKGGYEVHYIPIISSFSNRVGRSTVKVRDGFRSIVFILRTIMLFDPIKVFLPPSLLLFGSGLIFVLYTLITKHEIWKSGLLLILSGTMIFFFGLLADQIASIRREISRDE